MFCSQCRRSLDATTQVCPACGRDTGVVPRGPSRFVSQIRNLPAHEPRVSYAGFWLRFLAWVIDAAMLAGIGFFILGRLTSFASVSDVFGSFDPVDEMDNWLNAFGFGVIGFFFLFFLLISWIYYAAMESSPWQGTIGKRALGIIVTDSNGVKLDFWRASGRFFSRIVTNLVPLGIGYVIAGFTRRRQALHDLIASTIVLHKMR